MNKSFFYALSSILILFITSCNTPQKQEEKSTENIVVAEPVLLFDIPIDSFLIEKVKVKRNQNLSDILLKQNISYARIAQLVDIAKPVCNVRKIKAGNN